MTSPATGTTPGSAYTPSTVDALARAAYDAFNARDFGALATLYADDAVFTVVPTGQQFTGAAGVEQSMRAWIAAFDDARVEIDALHIAGDVAVCEYRGVGTHTGTFSTPMGDIPATGRRVSVPFCDVGRVRDGRTESVRSYFDAASFVRQLTG